MHKLAGACYRIPPRCGKCKQRKVTYYQLQTRSADEPMTNFWWVAVKSKRASAACAQPVAAARSFPALQRASCPPQHTHARHTHALFATAAPASSAATAGSSAERLLQPPRTLFSGMRAPTEPRAVPGHGCTAWVHRQRRLRQRLAGARLFNDVQTARADPRVA